MFKRQWHGRYFTHLQRRRQPVRALPQLEWQALELELQLARQQVQRQQPCGLFANFFISLSFSERVLF